LILAYFGSGFGSQSDVLHLSDGGLRAAAPFGDGLSFSPEQVTNAHDVDPLTHWLKSIRLDLGDLHIEAKKGWWSCALHTGRL
jgi:hypothetical protein